MGSEPTQEHEEVVPKEHKDVEATSNEQGDGDKVTTKAWICVYLLSLTFGVPFWGTPTSSQIGSTVLARMGSSELSAWVVPSITTAATVTILLFGVNSDLFGRRPFLLFSNLLNAVGYIVLATAKNPAQFIVGLSLNGAGSGTAGVALIACPELLPNKYRHVGVILADAHIFVFNLIGPIVARLTIVYTDDRWKYLYWAGFVIAIIALIGLFFLYHPPKHPRGVEWSDALKGLDYVGAILFTGGTVLVLVGIVYTTYLPTNDKRVVISLAVGFGLITLFGLWERLSAVKYPLCPHELFTSHKGREFAAPFALSFVVVGFFYGLAVIYPTMLNAFYIDASTPVSEQLALTLPGGFGLPVGAIALAVFGHKIGHWRWTLVASVTLMVLWGALLAMITPYNKGLMIAFVFLGQVAYGWAAYLAVTFTQMGVPQVYLGISGGLAGLARYGGGAVASAVYTAAIGIGTKSKDAQLIPQAALDSGLPASSLDQLVQAVSSGMGLTNVPGITPTIADAVATAHKYAEANGLRTAAFASLAFGVVGIVLAIACEDITPKMNEKIEIFLENDVNAERNTFH